MKEAWKELVKDFKEIKDKPFIYKLPSIITSIRLITTILIPIFFILGLPIVAIALAGIGSISDAVDGKLARKFNASSNFGAKLDAMCDKLFIFSLGISLITLLPVLSKILVSIMLINEANITRINMSKVFVHKKVKTTQIGRVKMVVLCVSLLLGFISSLLPILNIPTIISLLTTIGLQLSTMKSYKEQNLEEKKEEVVIENNTSLETTDSKEYEKQMLYTLKQSLEDNINIEQEKRKELHL